MKQRIYYLDNIRALAVLVLIPYHTARIYDWPPYYLQMDQLAGFEIFTRITDSWLMPLFFIIAGASAVYSLERRSTVKFFSERIKRLMVPFFIGMITLIPVNGYYAYQFHSGNTVSFIDYLPKFLTVKSLDGYQGTFTVSHLWFLVYLMLFSLTAPLFTPLVKWLKPRLGEHPGVPAVFMVIMIFCILLIAARLTALPYPNPIYFFTFFVAGLFLLGIPGLNNIASNYGKYFISASLITMPAYIVARMIPGLADTGDLWYETLQSLNALVCTLAIIYAGHDYLTQENAMLKWLNKQGLWIYIIHAPIISVIAYYLLPYLKVPFIAWLVIVILAFLLTLPLSALVVYAGDRIKGVGVK